MEVLPYVFHAAHISWFGRIRSVVADVLQLPPLGGGAGSGRFVALSHVVGEADAKRHPGVQRLRALLSIGGPLLVLQMSLWLGPKE
jgi:hypothetical protein